LKIEYLRNASGRSILNRFSKIDGAKRFPQIFIFQSSIFNKKARLGRNGVIVLPIRMLAVGSAHPTPTILEKTEGEFQMHGKS
jgi:hypothetical protein